MRTYILILLAVIPFSFSLLRAQDVTTVEATSSDISENLDLRAVATIFGEATDLEDFEKRLNDPEAQIFNLDLNADGYVDYLRVIETSKGNTHVVVIQAVLAKDVFQDVATIDVEKDNTGTTRVQVVGDVYMYGPNYIVEPYYASPPVIYVWFWGPRYNPWYSPYYWGYYPPYYSPWNPYPSYVYVQHVHVHVHRHPNTTYGYVGHRNSSASANLQQSVSRNDYAAKNPERTFVKRNEGLTNKYDIIKTRESATPATAKPMETTKPSARPVQENWKPTSERGVENKVVVPSEKQPVQTQQRTDPRQYDRPAVRPATEQQVKPDNRQPVQTTKPETRTQVAPTTPAVREPVKQDNRQPVKTTVPTQPTRTNTTAPVKPATRESSKPAQQAPSTPTKPQTKSPRTP